MSINADQITRPSGTFAPVTAHGTLEQLWLAPPTSGDANAAPPPPDGLWVVHGTFAMSPAGTFPRTMTVVRHSGGRVAVINSMRLDAAGEAALRALGPVDAVVRLGAFHGVDDDYYVRSFGATAYALPGSPLPPGLPVPPVPLAAGTAAAAAAARSPIPGAHVFVFAVTKAEAALHLPAFGPPGSGGTLVLCDAVINMGARPPHLTWLMAAIFRWTGFTGLRPAPLWYRFAKQQGGVDDAYMAAEYERLLRECPFGAVVFAHGDVITAGGHERIAAMARGLLPPS